MNDDIRQRIMNLSDDQLKSLFWQVFGAMTISNPEQIEWAIDACLPGIEARRF